MAATHALGWWAAFRQRHVIARGLKTAALVGTILAAINHGPAILSANMDIGRWAQLVLTYAVPFAVST